MEQQASNSQPLLRVEGLSVQFGGIRALQDVSFDVEKGTICGAIGPNGAGKTTLFNCLSRLYQPTVGRIAFAGRDLLAVPPHGIADLGVGRTFQNLAFFSTLSVLGNVMVGAHSTAQSGFLANGLRLGVARRDEAMARAHALQLLDLVDLSEQAYTPIVDLPFALQKRMEIARALAANPRLLLLDEPAAGLNQDEIGALGRLIRRVRDELGVTVLLVEHHMGLVMDLCEKLVVLDFGALIAEGTPQEIRVHPDVIRAYLGGVDAASPAN